MEYTVKTRLDRDLIARELTGLLVEDEFNITAPYYSVAKYRACAEYLHRHPELHNKVPGMSPAVLSSEISGFFILKAKRDRRRKLEWGVKEGGRPDIKTRKAPRQKQATASA